MFQHATRLPVCTDALAVATQAEIQLVELQLSVADLLDLERVRTVADSGTKYVVKFPVSLDVCDEALQNCVRLCRDLECDTIVIHQPMFDRFGPRLRELAGDLRLAVENNRQSGSAFEEWARDCDHLTLDVEHFWKFTLADAPLENVLSDLQEFFAKYADKIRVVQLTGYQPGHPVHRPMYYHRDLAFGVLSVLDKAGFNGPVVSQVAPEYLTRRDLMMDTQLVSSWKEQKAPVAV